MSAFIGTVKGPGNNSPDDAAHVHSSRGLVELTILTGTGHQPYTCVRTFNPIAARNLAALLVRASEEAERMAARKDDDE